MSNAFFASGEKQHRGRPLVELVVGGDLVVALDFPREAVHRFQQRLPAFDLLHRQRRRRGHVLDLVRRRVRVAGLEALVPPAEERALAEFPGERRITGHRHIGGERAAEAELVGGDGPDGRVVAERRAEPAGQHPVGGRLVVVVVVRPGPHERDLVHRLRQERQLLAELQAGDARADGLVVAADLGRGVRLRVEAVVVRQPAAEEDEDDGLGPRALSLLGAGLGLEHGGEREAGDPEAADAEEIPPG